MSRKKKSAQKRSIETIGKEITELRASREKVMANCRAYMTAMQLRVGELLIEAKQYAEKEEYAAFLMCAAANSPFTYRMIAHSTNKKGKSKCKK